MGRDAVGVRDEGGVLPKRGLTLQLVVACHVGHRLRGGGWVWIGNVRVLCWTAVEWFFVINELLYYYARLGVETYVVREHLLYEAAPGVPSQTPLAAGEDFIAVVLVSRVALVAAVEMRAGVVGGVGAVLIREEWEGRGVNITHSNMQNRTVSNRWYQWRRGENNLESRKRREEGRFLTLSA